MLLIWRIVFVSTFSCRANGMLDLFSFHKKSIITIIIIVYSFAQTRCILFSCEYTYWNYMHVSHFFFSHLFIVFFSTACFLDYSEAYTCRKYSVYFALIWYFPFYPFLFYRFCSFVIASFTLLLLFFSLPYFALFVWLVGCNEWQ